MSDSRDGHSADLPQADPAAAEHSGGQLARPEAGPTSPDTAEVADESAAAGQPGRASFAAPGAYSPAGAGPRPQPGPAGVFRPARAAIPIDPGQPGPPPPASSDSLMPPEYHTSSQPAPTPAPGRPPGRRLRLIVLIMLAALLIGTISMAAISTTLGNRRSKETLTRLLYALKAGDAAMAATMIDMGELDATNQPMLAADALAPNAGNFDYSTEFVRKGKPSAPSYQVTIRLNDTDKVVEWRLTEKDGEWLVNGTDVVTRLAIAKDHPHVINNVRIEPGTTTLLLLPGTYQVTTGMTLLTYNPAGSAFDLYTGGEATFQSQLQPAEGVAEAVTGEVRNQLNACATERDAPTSCDWHIEFKNGDLQAGTMVAKLDPPDPAAGFVMPVNFSADNNYVGTTVLRYNVRVSGNGIIWATGEVGTVQDETLPQTSYIKVDLSGEQAVVKIT